MALKYVCHLSGSKVPKSQHLILAGRYEPFAVASSCHAADGSGVAFEFASLGAGGEVPCPDDSFAVCGVGLPAVRRDCDGLDRAGVSPKPLLQGARNRVPDSHEPV